jgi:hypothetical protein
VARPLNANFSPAALDGVSVPANGLNSDLPPTPTIAPI